MDLAAMRAIVADDLQAVNEIILRRLSSDVVLINQVGQHIVYSGGKRVRPLVVLLAARAAGYRGNRHLDLAAIIELIHTATLLHDDVVDDSQMRRNQETANALWGNEASVLVGDFIYSRSFQMMVSMDSMRVMEVLSHATNRIAEGEVLQLLNCNDPDTTDERYLEVIRRKTATLFEAGTRLAASLAEVTAAQEQAAADFGLHLGVAFQLVDDALDYGTDSATLGKNIGDDLAEGKPTLPLIRALQTGTEAQRSHIRNAIEHGGRDDIRSILDAIESTGAIDYTLDLAREHARSAQRAIAILPPSPPREALIHLADFAVNRTY
jgi:octaprenyl-diphosphate synthase